VAFRHVALREPSAQRFSVGRTSQAARKAGAVPRCLSRPRAEDRAPTGSGALGAEQRGDVPFLKTEEAKEYSVAAFEKDGSRRSVEEVLAQMSDDAG